MMMEIWTKFKNWFEALANAVEYDPAIDHERRIAALENRAKDEELNHETTVAVEHHRTA
jgi:hypothetical protein